MGRGDQAAGLPRSQGLQVGGSSGLGQRRWWHGVCCLREERGQGKEAAERERGSCNPTGPFEEMRGDSGSLNKKADRGLEGAGTGLGEGGSG